MATSTCNIDMAEQPVNGSTGPDLDDARLVLLSNSSKKRTTQLQAHHEQIKKDGRY